MKIQWQEHTIDEIIQFFVDGYQLEPGQRIVYHKQFFDPTSAKVIIKLTIDEPDVVVTSPS